MAIPILTQINLTFISYLPFVSRQTPIISNALRKWAKKDKCTSCRVSGERYSDGVKIDSHHLIQYSIPFNPFRFASFNRFDMKKQIHKNLHSKYGYSNYFASFFIPLFFSSRILDQEEIKKREDRSNKWTNRVSLAINLIASFLLLKIMINI